MTSDSSYSTIIDNIVAVTAHLITEREKYREAWNKYETYTRRIDILQKMAMEIHDSSQPKVMEEEDV